MTCCVLVLTEQRVVALHEANRVRPCPGWLFLSPGEKNFSFHFPYPFLHSLFLKSTCLMSWHLSFSFYISPRLPPILYSITFPPCPNLLFLLHPMFFLLAFTKLQKGLRNSTILCYHETFSTTVLHILGANIHCPIFYAKGMRYARKKITF